MKKYYYSIDGEDKNGPVTLEELKQQNITQKTLIWYEGLSDWKTANSIDDLKPIFSKTNFNLDKPKIAVDKPKKSTEQNIPKMFSKSFSFDGRIRRLEYGLSIIIFYFLVLIINTITLETNTPLIALLAIPLYWFLIAQGAKRCHDRGNSGWFQLIPFYNLWMIFAEGESGQNRYGLNPKGK